MWQAIAFIVALAILSPSGEAATPNSSSPVKVSGFRFEFKNGIVGDVLSYEFTLINWASKPETLKGVTSSCACTTIVSSPKTLLAGGSAPLICQTVLDKPGHKQVKIEIEIAGQPNVSFYVEGTVLASVATVYQAPAANLYVQSRDLMQAKDVTFVDLRDPKAFDLAHVHGAINCSALDLPLKTFLSSKKLVIVGTGFDDQNLMTVLERCRKAEFGSVQILEGGIRLWQQQKGRLEGAAPNMVPLGHISVSDLVSSAQETRWTLFAPNAQIPDDPPDLCAIVSYKSLEDLNRQFSGLKATDKIAIFGVNALDVSGVDKPVFIVDDTLNHYIQATRVLTLSRAQTSDLLQSRDWSHRIKGCSTCP